MHKFKITITRSLTMSDILKSGEVTYRFVCAELKRVDGSGNRSHYEIFDFGESHDIEEAEQLAREIVWDQYEEKRYTGKIQTTVDFFLLNVETDLREARS